MGGSGASGADGACGGTHDDGVVGDVVQNHGVGADRGEPADVYAADQDGVGSKCCAIADGGIGLLAVEVGGGVLGGEDDAACQRHTGPKTGACAKGQRPRGAPGRARAPRRRRG